MNVVLFSATSPKKSATANSAPESDVCLSNIGPKEQRKRLIFGIIAFVFGIAVAVLLIATNANVLWRLVLFVPFAGAGIGYFQARDKTWVNLAARGARNMDNGIELIKEDDVKAQLRRQARTVYVKAIVAACVLTAFVLVIPIR